ncbi:MAG: type I restriction endonuclease subunit R, partial [Gammaproteobacteria bacterium]|nr:type I restriction endonuclease subunit R [Gammaproteobacteria bacterium]
MQSLGYTYAAPETLETERQSLRDVVLTARLQAALARLNPWLDADNTHKAVRAITNVHAASLLEANEQIHTALSHGIALEQDRGEGRKSHTVRFIDFEDPTHNELLVTRQYRVRGSRKHIIPDVVCFVNGIPLVVIECKSPDRGDHWRAEAIDQLDRYQELSERYRELGAPKLFETVQLLVATCGQDAVYGTIATPPRFFGQWKQAYPMTEAEVAKLTDRNPPTPQDIALCGLLAPSNLLDLVRYFVTFERDAHTGRTIKKVPRYQQYAAVNKAIERARRH